MSHRKQQIESTLQRAITQVLARRLSDPRLEGAMISVTGVRMTDDLQEAAVLVSVVPQQREQRVAIALEHAAGRVAGEIRKAVTMRTMPRLHFRLDATLKNQDRVYDALREAEKRRPEATAPPHPMPAAPDPRGQETAS